MSCTLVKVNSDSGRCPLKLHVGVSETEGEGGECTQVQLAFWGLGCLFSTLQTVLFDFCFTRHFDGGD